MPKFFVCYIGDYFSIETEPVNAIACADIHERADDWQVEIIDGVEIVAEYILGNSRSGSF